jgi:membrane protein
MSSHLPGGEAVWQVINVGVSLGVMTVLFALIFKVVPDVKIQWRDVWIGALATAVLFALGKFAIGLYLGRSSVGSPFGAAGSVVVLVVWVYYSTQILFFGAEFTQVYARHRGSRIEPSKNAVAVETETKQLTPVPSR